MSRLALHAAVLVFLCALTRLAPAQYCTAADFGPLNQDPIGCPGNGTVCSFATLDFQDREFVLDCDLTLTDDVTILCAKFTMTAGAKITGTGCVDIVVTAANGHDGSATINGLFDLVAPCAGSLDITADGDITLGTGSKIDGHGSTQDGIGGTVFLCSGGTICVAGVATTIDTSGGTVCGGGGPICLEAAGDVLVQQRLDTSGGTSDAGEVWIDAGGAITTTGAITSNGQGGSAEGWGSAACITLLAGGDITLSNDLDARGPDGNANWGGGDGGWITLCSGGDVTVNDRIRSEGGYDGCGGLVDVECAGAFTLNGNVISVEGLSGYATAGCIEIDAQGPVSLFGDLHLHSTTLGCGGAACITAAGDLSIASTTTIQTHSDIAGDVILTSTAGSITLDGFIDAFGKGSDGTGGTVVVNAFGDLSMTGDVATCGSSSPAQGGDVSLCAGRLLQLATTVKLDATGTAGGGSGTAGNIAVSGCAVTLDDDSILDARGATGGSITITAGDLLFVDAELRCDQTPNAITLVTRLNASVSPVTPEPGDFNPAPVVINDCSLPPCLAKLTTTYDSNSPVSGGTSLDLAITSFPGSPVFVIAGLFPPPNPIDLGIFGCTQTDVFNDAILADPGFGAATDGNGNWSASIPIPPGLSGITINSEAFVISPLALNGLFDQPPLIVIDFI